MYRQPKNSYRLVKNMAFFSSGLSVSLIIGLLIATVVTVITVILAVVHFFYIICYVTHRYRRGFILFLAGTAPLVSLFSLTAMYMPRVWFLAHLLSFFYFSMALWVIICLLRNIFEGRQEMLKKMKSEGSQITVQTPPFCCFFPCLPKLELERERIRFCEMMVFQAPCIRLIFTILSLVLFFEIKDNPYLALKVLDLVSVPSLLIGVYGTHILVTSASKLVLYFELQFMNGVACNINLLNIFRSQVLWVL
ncbi:unnamed protein product [Enterobius vermicularis]|uniref:Organic solute transporter alpha-like protein n=1 Tax=Enterobius vermicularis TaxID=51028 RepID=A0A0N4VMF9_ENTVE|nr:unnamed protein product [Enterobius vermicularis]